LSPTPLSVLLCSFAVKCLPKKYVGAVLEGLFSLRVQHEVDVLHHIGHSLNVAFFYGAYEVGLFSLENNHSSIDSHNLEFLFPIMR
jgi:hypothetical protein